MLYYVLVLILLFYFVTSCWCRNEYMTSSVLSNPNITYTYADTKLVYNNDPSDPNFSRINVSNNQLNVANPYVVIDRNLYNTTRYKTLMESYFD